MLTIKHFITTLVVLNFSAISLAAEEMDVVLECQQKRWANYKTYIGLYQGKSKAHVISYSKPRKLYESFSSVMNDVIERGNNYSVRFKEVEVQIDRTSLILYMRTPTDIYPYTCKLQQHENDLNFGIMQLEQKILDREKSKKEKQKEIESKRKI